MRISEIAQHEEFGSILCATLERGWSQQTGRKVEVSLDPVAASQEWSVQPLFSVIVSGRPSAESRRWMRDSFRYTPRRKRAAAQWILGTLMGSSLGVQLSGRPMLWVRPGVDRPGDRVILPGNRRVRIFDFGEGRCRVLLKAGYDPGPILNEVRVRGGTPGPFPAIISTDSAGTWFEEPIVAGFALPRCPAQRDRARYEAAALDLLAEHLARTSRAATGAARATALAEVVAEGARRLSERLGGDRFGAGFEEVVAALARGASGLGDISIAMSHGDFQPGNVLIESVHDRVLLTDWEHSDERFAAYDFLVWGLRSRFAAGLEGRTADFLATGAAGAAAAYLPEVGRPEWRRGALALFLLEELTWIVRDGLSGPRAALSSTGNAVVAVARRQAEDLMD